MNILFVNTTGGFFGGVEQNIHLAARGLSSRGHSCFFVCVEDNGRDREKFDTAFKESVTMPIEALREMVQAWRIDVVYVHKLDHIGPLLDIATGIPVVRMVHDHDLYCPRRHKYYAWNHVICERRAGLCCYADLAFLEKRNGRMHIASIRSKLREMNRNKHLARLVVGSRWMQHQLEKNGFDATRISLLPPCVEAFVEPLLPLPAEQAILYTGQLVKGKGVDILLAAHALACQGLGRGIPLHIIGGGNDEHRLKELASNSVWKDQVCFHGWVDHESLVSWYDRATVVVVPSRWPEPFGMVGLEAMSRQRPVVAARSGGIPDWLDDGFTGILVPPGDPQALSEALIKVLGDSGLAGSMGLAGLRRVVEEFSFGTYIGGLERILGGNA